MTRGLVLSLFPGIDLFGRAFEAVGYTVVWGPDVIYARDVRDWHVPPGRFDGVIGGPPCQCFTPLNNVNRARWGTEPKYGNLIPEFERVVTEARPAWWLMENVPEAEGPIAWRETFILSPRWLGDPQERIRRFWFSAQARLMERLPLVALEPVDRERTATSGLRGDDWRSGPTRSWPAAAKLADVQGYPGLASKLRGSGWSAEGACRALGNGVPRVMGEALARAIAQWEDEQRARGAA